MKGPHFDRRDGQIAQLEYRPPESSTAAVLHAPDPSRLPSIPAHLRSSVRMAHRPNDTDKAATPRAPTPLRYGIPKNGDDVLREDLRDAACG